MKFARKDNARNKPAATKNQQDSKHKRTKYIFNN